MLETLTGTGLWIGRPVELPQSRPLQFEYGNNLSAELQRWPSEHIVKCLVFYHPDDEPEMRAEQDQRLRDLFEACVHSGHELLLEIILPDGMPAVSGDLVRAMRVIYELGIVPDWWKLSSPDRDEWDMIEALIDQYDPFCRGVVLLGLNRPEEELRLGFSHAKGRKYCRGFAIGRSIFSAPAQQWLNGACTDGELVDAVAANFLSMVDEWKQAVSTEEQSTCGVSR